MIGVEQVKINVCMPSDEVRVVAMQPFIRLHSPVVQPLRWSDAYVDSQLDAISRTLRIARDSFDGQGANFTLFPEYAVPGARGVAVIEESVSEDAWPNESIIIAGVHGITKSEYKTLCDTLSGQVSEPNAPGSVPDDRWVNCCAVWVKDWDGVVQRWVQPKVRPAWPELNAVNGDMFCGKTVHVFECQYTPSGYPCRFVTLICFDWVACVDGSTVRDELLFQLDTEWAGCPTPLHWVFVIQHNPKPNDHLFLRSTYRFLTDVNAFPFVERDKAVVLHVNTAASPHPTRTGKGGFTSCVFSPSAQVDYRGCRPTVCTEPTALRDRSTLGRCKDFVFREMGECIHVFTVRVPRFAIPDASDRSFGLPLAHVYATSNSADPRLRGGSIPAAVKWINDRLDEVEPLSAGALAQRPLQARAKDIEPSIKAALRAPRGHSAAESVNWAACTVAHSGESRDAARCQNADLWDKDETEALEHVLHSLTCIGLAYDTLDVADALLHGSIRTDEGFVQIVAVRGKTHENCRVHYDSCVRKTGSDPILLITRDQDNMVPQPREYVKINEAKTPSGLAFLDYQTLATSCRSALDASTLKGELDARLRYPSKII